MLYNNAQQIIAFLKNSIHEVKLVPYFPVLHYTSMRFRSSIFRSYIFLPWKFGPSFSSRVGRSLI